MTWLVDNNVPRGVTIALRDAGYEAVEVRAVLGQDAPDAAIAAYAKSQGLALISHDRGLAKRAWNDGVPHVWLRLPEPDDRDRVLAVLPEIVRELRAGQVRVIVRARVLSALGPK